MLQVQDKKKGRLMDPVDANDLQSYIRALFTARINYG